MKITLFQLKKVIAEHVRVSLSELTTSTITSKDKPGQERADVQGTLNVAKLAEKLGIDANKFAEAYRVARTGKRNPSHNAIFADAFVKLLEASADDKAYIMGLLRAVKEKETSDTEKK